ncbi:hypothetical protein NDU88_002727 [Pleurodeles waltl]|uniref:Uncharacterized protein n=1 Tax=Pleurodeles waltl TaxID=8319 RepID=A0AAV7QDR6_PLEWA|nr:hypothetical protein NDU88_002727 [Pleurodeles waltl]
MNVSFHYLMAEWLEKVSGSTDEFRGSAPSELSDTLDGGALLTACKAARWGGRQVDAVKDLKWDFSPAVAHLVGGAAAGLQDPNNMNPPTLEMIFQRTMTHRKETRIDRRRAQAPMRKIQVAVHKVAKTCTAIAELLSDLETRTADLETDAAATRGLIEMDKLS